jgi:hypothetical protein
MTEIRIVVWQFVRIMVQLETEASRRRPKGGGGRSSLFESWREAWEELDAKLTDLGKRDHRAYSNLMMDQEVVLECASAGDLAELVQTVDRVIKRLGDMISRKQGKVKDLRFELREMKTLRQELEATQPG